MKSSLRLKILAPFVVSSLILMLYLYYVWLPQTMEEEIHGHLTNVQAHLNTLGKAIIEPLITDDFASLGDILDEVIKRTPNWQSLRLVDFDDQTLYASHSKIHKQGAVVSSLRSETKYLGKRLATLYLETDIRPQQKLIHSRFISILQVLFVALLVFLVFISLSTDFLVLRPLSRLVVATSELANGKFTEDLPRHTTDEVGELVVNFLHMQDSVQAYKNELENHKMAMDEHSIVCVSDKDRNIIYVNDELHKKSGYEKADLIGMNFLYLASLDADENLISNIWGEVSSGKIWHGILKNRTKECAVYYTDTTIVPFMDSEGRIYQYIQVETDITEQKNAESEIRRASERLSHMVNHSPTIIYSSKAGMDFNIFEISENAENVLGYTTEEILGSCSFWNEKIHPMERYGVFSCMKELHDKGEVTADYRFYHKDNGYIYLQDRIRLIRDEEGHPLEMIGSVTNVTDVVVASKNNRQLKETLDRTMDSVYIFDENDFKLTYVNNSALRQSGYAEENLLGNKAYLILGNMSEDEFQNITKQSRHDESGAITYETKVYNAVGVDIPVEISLQHIRFQDLSGIYVAVVRDITERKKAQEEINNLARFPAESPDPVLRVDTFYHLLYYNTAAEEILACWGIANGNQIPESLGKYIEKALQSGITKVELGIDHKVFSVVIAPVLGSGYVNLYLRDISEKIRVQEKLQNRATEQKAIADLGQSALVSHDLAKLCFDAVSISVKTIRVDICEIYEVNSKEETFALISSSMDRNILNRSIGGHCSAAYQVCQTLEQNSPVIADYPGKFNQLDYHKEMYISVSLSVPIQSREKPYGVLVVHSFHKRDFIDDEIRFLGSISNTLGFSIERKNADEKLKLTNARLEHLLTVSPAVIYSAKADASHDATFVSDNVSKIFEYSPSDFTCTDGFWLEKIHPDDRSCVVSGLQNLAGNGIHSVEYRFRDANNTYRWMRDEIRLVCDENGIARECVGSWFDITDKKRVETELIAYKDHLQELVDEQTGDLRITRDAALSAERSMSAFLANMSHELRTPLHGILSFANFGINKYESVKREKLAEYYIEIRNSGEHLLNLVNNLLDLSKLRAGKMSYNYEKSSITRVVKVITNELALIAEKGDVLFTFEEKYVPEVIFDRERISQVIRNLLSNAIKFSPQFGIINIIINYTDTELEVSIKDQGVGIPGDELATIFDVFAQSSKTATNAGGTGLGLPICKEIVEGGHNGRIYAVNNSDKGACFTFILPNKIEN